MATTSSPRSRGPRGSPKKRNRRLMQKTLPSKMENHTSRRSDRAQEPNRDESQEAAKNPPEWGILAIASLCRRPDSQIYHRFFQFEEIVRTTSLREVSHRDHRPYQGPNARAG